MKKSVNLNSQEWCDMIFKDKNKSYGAYEMRMTSSKRHIAAFLIVILLTVLVAFLPMLISKASELRKRSLAEETEITLSKVTIDNVEEPEVIDVTPPEPPKLNREDILNSVQYTAPVIDIDENVADDVEVNTVDEVIHDTRAVGYMNVDDGTDDLNAELQREEAELISDPADAPKAPREFAEVMPQFPGGNAEMMKFIKENLRYPTVDLEQGRQGRVIVRFVVAGTGEIEQIEVQSGVSPSCDREAIRVIQSMPKWIPGKQNGVPVAVYFTLPVLYRIL